MTVLPNFDSSHREAKTNRRPLDTEVEREARNLLAHVIKKSGKTRAEIAEGMGRTLGRPFSKSLLDEFLRSPRTGRAMRFPAAWVKAFCEATGCDELWSYLAPESSRHALAARAGIVDSRDAVARAQEALGRVQVELARLAEGKKPKGAKG